MKKILLIGCIILFIFCAPKQSTVETEGLEEVVVFGEEEETANISEEPVLPQPVEEEVVAPPPAEEETPPPVAEEEPPPLPLVEEEVVVPPPVVEEELIELPPVEEVITPPPVVEEELIELPPVEEVITPPPIVEEEPYVPPTTPSPPPRVGAPGPAPSPTPPPAKIFGFRVQIFASSTEKNASKVADDAKSAFGEGIYVEYVPPYYKVRVGNCLTREDAEFLRKKAVKLGYRGSFIVETMITP